jgi:hypothetical protein
MPLILEKVDKPRVFLWGGCDLYECATIDIIRQNFSIDILNVGPHLNKHLDFDHAPKTASLITSLISLYYPAGVIAERVYDTLSTSKDKLKTHHYAVHKEICKFPYLEFFRKNATNQDILLLSFSTEFYTKISQGKERFTILPQLTPLADTSDPLHWLFSEYISNAKYQTAFDEPYSLHETFELLKEFAKDIKSIFGTRVIIVKTHLTSLGYESNIGRVSKLTTSLDTYLPFYKTSRIKLHDGDHSYAERQADLIVKGFMRYFGEQVPVIALQEPFFIDLNHPHGLAPFHLHQQSSYKIGMLINNALHAMCAKEKLNG